MKTTIVRGMLWLALVSLPASGAETNRYDHTTKLKPGKDDFRIASITARILERSHYLQKPLDDELSARWLQNYYDFLDPQHMMLFQSDLEEWERLKKRLARWTVQSGETRPAYDIFNRFMEHFEEHVAFMTNTLKTATFDFSSTNRYLVLRRDAPRPKDLAEARKLWRERLEYEFLQEKLAGKKPETIVTDLTRRYARSLRLWREIESEEALQFYLSSLTRSYDPHSEYMAPPSKDQFDIHMRLSVFGIGAMLQSEDGYCTIRELTPGGPAIKSGKLHVKDKIVGVAQGTNEFVDVIDEKLNRVVNLVRGKKGTEVRLKLIPADAPETRRIISLVRDEVKLEDQEAKAKLIELPEGDRKLRLGYIDLPSFYADFGNRTASRKSTTTDVAKLLKKLIAEKMDGLILDLRRNGGGSLEEAISLTGLFIKQGPVVQVREPSDDSPLGNIIVDSDNDPSVLYTGPLIVLTSRGSASASEILAGALQDYGRALVVGDQSTHGKGTVQTLLELNNLLRTTNSLGALKFTIRKFYRPSGSSTQLKGVTPDIILPSIANHADGGEGSISNALPWDTIPSARFTAVNQVTPILEELRARSSARVEKEPDYAWLREEIARYLKTKDDKTVSLNEAERQKEKKDNEARAEARKKDLRARPEPKWTTYDLTLKLCDQPGLPAPTLRTNTVAKVTSKAPAAPEKKTDDDGEDEVKDESVPPVDMTLDEARRILVDLIQLWPKSRGVAVRN